MGHSFHTQTHMHRADLAAQLGYGGPPPFWDDEDMFAGAPPACGPAEFWDDAHQACVPLTLPMPSTTSPVQCPPGQFFDYFKQNCVATSVRTSGEFVPDQVVLALRDAPLFRTDAPGAVPIAMSGEGLVRIVGRNQPRRLYRIRDLDHPDAGSLWISEDFLRPYTNHETGALGDVTIGPHLISPLGWPYAWGQAAGIWGQRDVSPDVAARRDDSPYRGDRGGGTGNPDWATVALVGIGVAGVLGLGYLLVRR